MHGGLRSLAKRAHLDRAVVLCWEPSIAITQNRDVPHSRLPRVFRYASVTLAAKLADHVHYADVKSFGIVFM